MSLGEGNTVVHAARPKAGNDQVRRSSPDLVYSACVFDLSDGPLHVTAPVPDSYMSVSFYAANTDNFYVKNDLQVDGRFDVVLVGPGTSKPGVEGAEVVRAPSCTGGILFRYFAGDGQRKLFYLGERHLHGLELVEVDGVSLPPAAYCFHRTGGWISLGAPPLDSVVVYWRSSRTTTRGGTAGSRSSTRSRVGYRAGGSARGP